MPADDAGSSVEIRAAQIESALRALQLAAAFFELGRAVWAEVGGVEFAGATRRLERLTRRLIARFHGRTIAQLPDDPHARNRCGRDISGTHPPAREEECDLRRA